MSKVAIVKCESYDKDEVFAAVKKALELLGGMSSFVKVDEKTLLKPNILAGEPPEKCVTTHPAVFWAAAKLAQEAGADLVYGDSPGIAGTESAARKSEIAQAAEELAIPLADFSTPVAVHYPDGKQNKQFTIAKGVEESDCIISIPKLKTHALEKYTGAVKNQFGCIPGTLKAEFHVKLPDADSFAQMLLDLNGYLRPRLCIMDGVMAMEGNGPRGGTPVKTGVIIAADNPVALDFAACRIINVDPALVPVVRIGLEGAKEPEILGEPIANVVRANFNIDRTPIKPAKGRVFMKFAGNRWLPKPVIDDNRCLKCGVCLRACPVPHKALDWKAGKTQPPVYDYGKCIRCYCCQEMCPEKAIRLKKPLVRRLLRK